MVWLGKGIVIPVRRADLVTRFHGSPSVAQNGNPAIVCCDSTCGIIFPNILAICRLSIGFADVVDGRFRSGEKHGVLRGDAPLDYLLEPM